MEDEKIVFLCYRSNDTVIRSEFSVDKDYDDIDNILHNDRIFK